MAITTPFRDLARRPGFHAFLWTQLLGAVNDNIYRMVVSLRAVRLAAASGSSSEYLALTGAAFVIPFLLFSGYAGHLADAISKRKVMIAVKAFEVLIMLLGLAALFSTRIEWMLLVLFLMSLRATIFSPAKYGIIPETMPEQDLSRANALIEMVTFAAIVVGTTAGAFLFARWSSAAGKMGVVTLAIAVVGLVTSFRIARVPAAGAQSRLNLNPFAEIVTGTKHILRDRSLWLTVLAISYFWFLGMLVQMNLLLFGSEVLHVNDFRIGMMVTVLAIGTGAGSLLAGRLSGPKVEPGMVTLGSCLMAMFCAGLFLVKGSYIGSSVTFFCLGVSSAMYFIPLNAYLQKRSNGEEKGRVIATANFYGTVGLLLAPGTLWIFHDALHVTPAALFVIFGLLTLAVTIYLLVMVPEHPIRFFLWMVTHTLFKVRIVGKENLPLHGPALLVINHVSHADGFLIAACMQRFIRFMIWKPYFEVKFFAWFFGLARAIPAGTSGPRDVVESLHRARKELEAGHVVAIFPEGSISRTGNLLPFKRGFEKIVDKVHVPVIPVHLDGLWGSVFSFKGGKFFWKRGWKLRDPVTISFGQPISPPTTAYQVRQAILDLGASAAAQRKKRDDVLPLRFIRMARKNWWKRAIADSTGRTLTYGQALAQSLMIAKRLPPGNSSTIGILLPADVRGVLANLAVSVAGKTAINGEATASATLTSRAFLSEQNLRPPHHAIYLEELQTRPSLTATLAARLLPAHFLVSGNLTPDSIAIPGLTHFNLVSAVDSLSQVLRIAPQENLVAQDPFFDAFGLTMTLWFPLLTGCEVVYREQAVTRIRLLLAGSNGKETPIETYGWPIISVNAPDWEAGKETQLGTKPGTSGHPLPGIAVKVVDPITFEPRNVNQDGLLMVKGPSFPKQGWNATGDIAAIDDDGFIRVTEKTDELPLHDLEGKVAT